MGHGTGDRGLGVGHGTGGRAWDMGPGQGHGVGHRASIGDMCLDAGEGDMNLGPRWEPTLSLGFYIPGRAGHEGQAKLLCDL